MTDITNFIYAMSEKPAKTIFLAMKKARKVLKKPEIESGFLAPEPVS